MDEVVDASRWFVEDIETGWLLTWTSGSSRSFQ